MKTSNKTKPHTAASTAKPVSLAKAKPTSVAPTKAVPAKKTSAKPAPKVVPSRKTAEAAQSASVKAKAAAPIAAKAVVDTSLSRPAVAKSDKAASVSKKAQASPAKSMNVTKVETVKSSPEQAPSSAAAAPDQLVRATRPSARLAQITVPSLPPAVASTAAKSSFLPNASQPAVSMPFVPIKKDPKLANNWKTKKVDELTDAEILAMPDSEYMNEVQMAFFRLKLTQLKLDILNSAGQTTEHLREDTVVVPDPADRATIEEEHALELRTRDRERKLLKKIEQSIHRIDAGDYGFCDETGEAIGVGRLLARPTATLSLEAQQRRELKQKMFGD